MIDGEFILNFFNLSTIYLIIAVAIWASSKPLGRMIAPNNGPKLVAPTISLREATDALIVVFGI